MTTPRCGLPTIVIENAPKKTTIRGMASTPADQQGQLEFQEKERFRQLFAHASKSQVKSLISMLGNLNRANQAYNMYLMALKPDSKLVFKVNVVSNNGNVERPYTIDADKVELGMDTFDKGLRNVYYYYKFRGTKKSKRTGNKEEDDLTDLQSFKVFHRHLWVPVGSPLYTWLTTEMFPTNENFAQTVRASIANLIETEQNSDIGLQFKGGKPILHILNSTIQRLFYILFETNPSSKISFKGRKDIPRELKQAQYRTSPGIQQLYAGMAVHRVKWDETGEKPVVSPVLNIDPKYTIGSALEEKLTLRKAHKQNVYHGFNAGIIYMKDFMSITSLGTVSSERMHMLYDQYSNYLISRQQLSIGQEASGIVDYEVFRGDERFGQNLIGLQTYVNNAYHVIKDVNDAGKPATVRKTMRTNMSSILEQASQGSVVASGTEL